MLALPSFVVVGLCLAAGWGLTFFAASAAFDRSERFRETLNVAVVVGLVVGCWIAGALLLLYG